MSESKLGRISFMNSTTVTSLPMRLKTEANSMPITPPPMTHMRRGTRSMSSSSLEVSTPGSVAPGTGSSLLTEPVATMMRSAVYASPPATTVWASAKSALARTRVMSLFLSRVSMPEARVATTWFFRSTTLAKSSE